jgi:hypothetical protein
MFFPAPNLAFFRAVSALLAPRTQEMSLLLRLSHFTAVAFVMTRKLVVGTSNGFFGDRRRGLLESNKGTQGRLLSPLLSFSLSRKSTSTSSSSSGDSLMDRKFDVLGLGCSAGRTRIFSQGSVFNFYVLDHQENIEYSICKVAPASGFS